MSDVTHPQALAHTTTRPLRKPWPLLPYGLVAAGGAVGLLAGRLMGGDADDFESRLLLLLRFMAAMKFLGVMAAAGLTHWRLSQAIPSRLALLYFVTLSVMALAAGLIWSLGAIALGAILFHVGLFGFLVLAWKDDGARLPRRV